MELLRDRSAEFEAAGVQAAGISRDSPWTHIAWMQALDLSFPLLSDWNADAVRALDIGFEFRGLHEVSRRSAFLVDRDGLVHGAWSYASEELPDVDELVEAAQSLRART